MGIEVVVTNGKKIRYNDPRHHWWSGGVLGGPFNRTAMRWTSLRLHPAVSGMATLNRGVIRLSWRGYRTADATRHQNFIRTGNSAKEMETNVKS